MDANGNQLTRSDQVTHTFVIYEIKRSLFKPIDYFKWTKFYESNSEFVQFSPEIQLDLKENEFIICSTFIDTDNYSLLTTQRIVIKENSIEEIGEMAGATTHNYPFYIGLEKFNYVVGTVLLQNGNEFRHFIEAGKAAAVMIYGIRTLVWSHELTDKQMLNLMRIWDRKREALNKALYERKNTKAN